MSASKWVICPKCKKRFMVTIGEKDVYCPYCLTTYEELLK